MRSTARTACPVGTHPGRDIIRALSIGFQCGHKFGARDLPCQPEAVPVLENHLVQWVPITESQHDMRRPLARVVTVMIEGVFIVHNWAPISSWIIARIGRAASFRLDRLSLCWDISCIRRSEERR